MRFGLAKKTFSTKIGNSKKVVLFPGQGSQYLGMGKYLTENFDYVKQGFEEANAAVGFDLAKLMMEGPDSGLLKTENSQPATVLNSVLTLEYLKREHGLQIDNNALFLGHSLGEIAALVAAESLSLGEAIRLTKMRGRIMQKSCPEGEGTMWVVFQGADFIKEALREFEETENLKVSVGDESPETICNIAAINQLKQTVISGNKAFLSKVVNYLKKKKRVRSVSLRVSAAFHSNYLLKGQEEFDQELAKIDFKAPTANVISTVDGELISDATKIRSKLVDQFVQPVLFNHGICHALGQNYSSFIEVGANSLTPMVEKILIEQSIPQDSVDLEYWKFAEERLLKQSSRV